MGKIRQYSREYFVSNTSEKQKEALNGLKNNKNLSETKSVLSESVFVGSVDKLKKSNPQNDLIKQVGLNNLIDILDADKDGNITSEEFRNIASLDMDEFDDSEISLSAKDLLSAYKNANDAKGAVVTTTGLREETYKYKDGLNVIIQKDEKGNVITRSEEQKQADGTTKIVTYSYLNNTRYTAVKDKQGRIISNKTETGNILKDREYKTVYKADGTQKKTITTVGKETTLNINNNKVSSKSVKVNYSSDGEIGATKQQDVGNCYVLSGINALNTTSGGRKIIKDAIKHNEDGSVTVKLKGLNQSVTFSAEEVAVHQYTDKSKQYSIGDVDMNIIEMAINKLKRERIEEGVTNKNGKLTQVKVSQEANLNDPSNYGTLDEMFFYLTGKKSSSITFESFFIDSNFDKKMKNPDKYAITVQFRKSSSKYEDIVPKHAYAVSRVTKDTVYIINPHDASKEISYPRKDFINNIYQAEVLDVSKLK